MFNIWVDKFNKARHIFPEVGLLSILIGNDCLRYEMGSMTLQGAIIVSEGSSYCAAYKS